ncbi:spermine/spermidine synthase domain-containing protein [Nocardioides marmoraquaticus]
MELQEVARAESERGEVVLRRRTSEHAAPVLELRVNGIFVMDTRETSTELALATAALDLVEEPRAVVVGGLGLGFTLQAVLADPRVERVRVVEVEESLVGWMRDGTVPHGPGVLADRRVEVVVGDVVRAVAEAKDQHDLVLLDVDNGPGHLVHTGNAAAYSPAFLTGVRRLLRPGGCLVVWSAGPAPDLLATLRDVFSAAEEQELPVTLQQRETSYYLYLARA